MINLVLHPGHSKCGSTTIQDFVYENRKIFLKRGVFIPDINFNFWGDPEYKFNLTQTPRAYFAKVQSGEIPLSDLEIKLDKLVENAEKLGCRRVILSAENLINGIGLPSTAGIHKLLNKKFSSVNVVYYIRKQSDLFVSAWQQWAHKKGEPLDEYIERMIKTSFGDYLFIVNKLHKYYPNKNFNVFPLHKKSLYNSDLIEDFCLRAKINSKGLKLKINSSNSGLSSTLCQTMSSISGVYKDVHDQDVKQAITNLTPHSNKIREKKYGNDISTMLMKELFGKFEESNKELGRKYFPDISFSEAMSLSHPAKNLVTWEEELLDKIERLEDLVTIQMDMILQLHNRLENGK